MFSSFFILLVVLYGWPYELTMPDLKTISEQIESEMYDVTVEMFIADVKKMVANTRTLYSPQSAHSVCIWADMHDFQLLIFFFHQQCAYGLSV
ncbi:unnamed protein product [Cuscuta campestris]|uniref:Bromo domain-containing protein n=1 Tax=Cuscuta campestris TaxID=132261 RepID=A0A484MKS2_9ASTE|nr:unnamed protein product [Cuscuta campestris]